MKFLLTSVLKTILQVQYLISTYKSSEITLKWMIDHTGSNGNYPYLPSHTPMKGYRLDQIQLVIRHGTRYPVQSGMVAIHYGLHKLNTSTNRNLIGWIDTYQNDYLPHRTGQLDRRGQHELYSIGRQWTLQYPEFMRTLDLSTIRVSASLSSRTLQSAQAFCLGAFEGLGTLGPAQVLPIPIFSKENDSIISPHKACPRWQQEAKALTSYWTAPVINRYVRPIAYRLSHALRLNITVNDVLDYFTACVSEVAIHQRVDTFCKLFAKHEVLKLEYIDDLKHYYKYSYGFPHLNQDMACDLAKHLLDQIDTVMNNTVSAVKFNVLVGHSETMLPLRTLLGLYKDNLSPNSTDNQIEHRQYRLSKFGYFANHLAFQLLTHTSTGQRYVLVLDNEIPISIHNKTLMTIDEFRSFMVTRTQCNFIEFCKINK